MRDLAMRMAVLSSLADGLRDDGSGTRKAAQAASRERFHALVEETLGPIGGPNGEVIVTLRAAFEKSLQATNFADRQRAIEREAFPAFHDAKVKSRTDDLAGFLTQTLISVTPVVAEIKAGYRAYQALNDYETAVAINDRAGARLALRAFATALSEMVPVAGRAAKAARHIPALNKAKAKVDGAIADLREGMGPIDPLGNTIEH